MQKVEVKELVKNRQEALVLNELSDDDGRYVVDVVAGFYILTNFLSVAVL